jgi:hypothetical protein
MHLHYGWFSYQWNREWSRFDIGTWIFNIIFMERGRRKDFVLFGFVSSAELWVVICCLFFGTTEENEILSNIMLNCEFPSIVRTLITICYGVAVCSNLICSIAGDSRKTRKMFAIIMDHSQSLVGTGVLLFLDVIITPIAKMTLHLSSGKISRRWQPVVMISYFIIMMFVGIAHSQLRQHFVLNFVLVILFHTESMIRIWGSGEMLEQHMAPHFLGKLLSC